MKSCHEIIYATKKVIITVAILFYTHFKIVKPLKLKQRAIIPLHTNISKVNDE